MQGLAEAGESRLESQVGPEDLENLIAVELMVWLDRQELDQRPGLRSIPRCVRDEVAVAADLEGTEYADGDGRGLFLPM